MTTGNQVPALGESVTEATVAKWLKAVGDAVAVDEPLVELETDKVTLEVNATPAGTLAEIVAAEGDTVEVGAVLGADRRWRRRRRGQARCRAGQGRSRHRPRHRWLRLPAAGGGAASGRA